MPSLSIKFDTACVDGATRRTDDGSAERRWVEHEWGVNTWISLAVRGLGIRRSLRGRRLDVGRSGGGGPTPEVAEKVGVAQEALTLSGESNLNTVLPVNTRAPSVAWIRTPDSVGIQQLGRGLVGFTRNETLGPRAAWSYSVNWSGGAPTWTTRRSNDTTVGILWPPPANLCEIFAGAFECDNTGDGWNKFQPGTNPPSVAKGRYNNVVATLYPGLNGVGAILTTAGYDVSDEDLAIAISVDGGETFKQTLLLTVLDADGNDTGIAVDPDSVHASVANFGEVTTPRAGDISLPIYVTWRATNGFTSSWYWTRVAVGVSGTVAEVMKPKKLAFVPANPGNHASIFGWRIDGVEHIGVAWSERADAASPPTCPSTLTTSVTWWISQSNDFGETRSCFKGGYGSCLANCNTGGSTRQKTALAAESAWKVCVGPNQSSRQSRNNDRVEVAMNAPATASGNGFDEKDLTKRWYFAVTKRGAGGPGMRVCVLDHDPGALPGSNDRINALYCSNDTDPGGLAVQDAWGHSMTVMNSEQDDHLLTVLMRESASAAPNLIRMVAMQDSPAVAKTEARITTDGGGVPFGFEGDWGLNTGLATYQKCDSNISGCPLSPTFSYPALGMLAVWPDTRTAPTRNEIFVRSFTW